MSWEGVWPDYGPGHKFSWKFFSPYKHMRNITLNQATITSFRIVSSSWDATLSEWQESVVEKLFKSNTQTCLQHLWLTTDGERAWQWRLYGTTWHDAVPTAKTYSRRQPFNTKKDGWLKTLVVFPKTCFMKALFTVTVDCISGTLLKWRGLHKAAKQLGKS